MQNGMGSAKGLFMLAQESQVACGYEMDQDKSTESVGLAQANAGGNSAEETLECFRSRRGLQVRVVEYQEAFFQALVRMYEDFEPKRGAQGLPPVGRDRLVSWLRPLCDNNLNLIALLEDRVIGHSILCPMNTGGAEFAIFIHQEFRNQGIGSQLTGVTLQYGRTKGLQSIWLTVEVNNFSAIRVYRKMGFEISGTYYPEVEMALDLAGKPS
jgi:ribosomal protein S18 acetylase RimI-like enzyme